VAVEEGRKGVPSLLSSAQEERIASNITQVLDFPLCVFFAPEFVG
jgi:hypothetical protein